MQKLHMAGNDGSMEPLMTDHTGDRLPLFYYLFLTFTFIFMHTGILDQGSLIFKTAFS